METCTQRFANYITDHIPFRYFRNCRRIFLGDWFQSKEKMDFNTSEGHIKVFVRSAEYRYTSADLLCRI